MHRKKMFSVTIGLVFLVSLMGIAPVEARDSSVYKKNGAATQQKSEAATQQKATTGLRFATSTNLVIYAPALWVVLRLDSEKDPITGLDRNSLTVTSSDSEGAALWFAPEPTVTGNTISATCNLVFGDLAYWASTLSYEIVIRGGAAFIYERSSLVPGVTVFYRGKAARIVTFD
jgi:hypothetical protein